MDSWLLPRTAGGPETAAPSTPVNSDIAKYQGKIQKLIWIYRESQPYPSTKKKKIKKNKV